MNTAEMLGISDRHFRRLLRACREEGASGLLSKRRGKPSNNRKHEKEKNKAVKLGSVEEFISTIEAPIK